MVQCILAVLSLIAVWLSLHRKHSYRKLSPIFGLSAQPFWLYATATSLQWGMFALSVAYTVIWAKAGYEFWIKNNEEVKD